jgi:glycosyltransferase involved in cell wall biosynthesis
MKILMLGWEFPPYFAGGVGIVCYELTKALIENFSDITIEYVMAYGPKKKEINNSFKITSANTSKILKSQLSIKKVSTLLYSYDSVKEYEERRFKILDNQIEENSPKKTINEIYGKNLLEEVYLYSLRIESLYSNKKFDIIHAHDWTTVPAAIKLKKKTGKPFIFHVHITELDKTGGKGGWDEIFKIEKEGFYHADSIIAVSNFVKNRLINNYGVDPNKIIVIHNGGISDLLPSLSSKSSLLPFSKMVLFAGRMTLQKGPEYFVKAAKKVLEYDQSILFVMIGDGDMLEKIIQLTLELGVYKNFYFHGRYSRKEAEEFFSRADVFVMPSVSEPFGIVPLEAVVKGTPTIISKQSGISEVLHNSLKVDFWDVDEMAHKILALLYYPSLYNHIKIHSFKEIEKFNWRYPAKKTYNVYNTLMFSSDN